MTKRKKEYVKLDTGEVCEVVSRDGEYVIVVWNPTLYIKLKSPKNATEQEYKAQFVAASL